MRLEYATVLSVVDLTRRPLGGHGGHLGIRLKEFVHTSFVIPQHYMSKQTPISRKQVSLSYNSTRVSMSITMNTKVQFLVSCLLALLCNTGNGKSKEFSDIAELL